MKIQDILQYEAEEIYDFILQYIQKNNLDTKVLFDYQEENFGSLSLSKIIENRSKYLLGTIKHIEYQKNIMPSEIIATSRHPHFCNKSFKDIFLYQKREFIRLLQYLKMQNPNFAFESNNMTLQEKIEYYAFEYCGKKRFIIVQGHHRSLLAYLFSLIDNSYMLNDVDITEYIIDWNIVKEKMSLEQLYLDNKKLENYFSYSKSKF